MGQQQTESTSLLRPATPFNMLLFTSLRFKSGDSVSAAVEDTPRLAQGDAGLSPPRIAGQGLIPQDGATVDVGPRNQGAHKATLVVYIGSHGTTLAHDLDPPSGVRIRGKTALGFRERTAKYKHATAHYF